jgi:transcriptional regulator with XRE-family HTH domain
MSLKDLCEKKKTTLTGLSKQCGISIVYLSNLNTGNKRNPSLDVLNKISKNLGVTIDELEKSIGGNK